MVASFWQRGRHDVQCTHLQWQDPQAPKKGLVVLAEGYSALQRVSLETELIVYINSAHVLVKCFYSFEARYFVLFSRFYSSNHAIKCQVTPCTQDEDGFAIPPRNRGHPFYPFRLHV
ncbi:hypothetical protein PC118_g23362 [Phytophthora cactorum]|uniref:Uncharacterized protein n=1 Tax=Phytophthora cactorum TaxID=29920 RepID=A0A8T1F0R0_9STRA|nr:hypothetical protein PC118_g23362 [Phytophthora cactorum]